MKWTPERKARHAALIKELWRQGRYGYRKPPTFHDARCAVCATKVGLRHFYLSAERRKPDGRMGQRGAGAIDLCSRCWSDATRAARFRAPRLRNVA